MKHINKIGVMLTAGFMLAAASCTDYSDYNSEPSFAQAEASQTLWENIKSDQQLTKFTALAEKSRFSTALSSPRFYTVWAPVDAAFSDADYNALMASDSTTIVNHFMHQHITEYNYPVSSALDSTTIVSLNAKHHPFTQQGFDDFDYVATNLPAVNGVLHKINGVSEFHKNLYESFDDLTDTLFKQYIQKYDDYYLDVAASVIGPLVEGKQTYLDSVLKKRNNVIDRIMSASLDNEDSTYCLVIPNDQAWADAYAKVNPCYNYIPKMDYMDLTKKNTVASSTKANTAKAEQAAETTGAELQDSVARRNIVQHLVFSHAYASNAPLFGEGSLSASDTVISTSLAYLTNANSVIDHTIATAEMSNGMTRLVDSLTFKPWETYNPIISVRKPESTLKVVKTTTHNVAIDSLKGERDTLFSPVKPYPVLLEKLLPHDKQFFTYEAVDSADIEGKDGSPEFCFALRGVRSTTYRIYVVTVPAQVENPQAAVKPYYLRFYLSYTDAANKQQYMILPETKRTDLEITTDEGTTSAKTIYVGNPGRVNVLDLGEVSFPACYYGTDAYPSLMMMHTKAFRTTANREKYDQQLRVAGVYLVPKEYNDLWANSSN